MPRMKKTITRDIQNAKNRLDGLKAISPTLDLGEGVSVVTLEAAIDEQTDLIGEYNSLMSQADEKLNLIDSSSKELNQLSSRALKGVEFKYGRDSNEYEMAGGIRTSERKKPTRKTVEKA